MADMPANQNPTASNAARRSKRRRENSGIESAELHDEENQARPATKRIAVEVPEEPEEPKEPEEPEEPEDPPRLKKFRSRCPVAVQQRMERVRSQRMFCLGRERDEGNLREDFKIAGSTGNIYTVVLENIPMCDCPDSARKNQTCKHILFVMTKVLRVRPELSYQAALLNSEIREIFEKSSIPIEDDTSENKRLRKPLDSDECPVCYESFEESDEKNIFFCAAQCGSNIHKECFRQWAASRIGDTVTCVMCRTPWEENSADVGEYGSILKNAKKGDEGYLNVAEQLGLGSRRDTSTYHQSHWWH